MCFWIFGITSTHFGIVLSEGEIVGTGLVLVGRPDQMIVSLSLIAVVIAGLLGGPIVGFGAGIIAAVHLVFLGGVGWFANMLVNPLTGLLAGINWTFFFKSTSNFSDSSTFIGVFPPILHMQFLLVLYPQNESILKFVNLAGFHLYYRTVLRSLFLPQ